MTKGLLLLLPLALLAAPSAAQDSQTSYNFLRLPVSAHAAAMGGPGITLTDDDVALAFDNPALLTSASDKELHLGFMTYMQGATMASAAFSKVVAPKMTVAAQAQYMSYGSMKLATADGQVTGDFSARDIALGATLGYMLSERWAGGITARMVMGYIGGYSSVAMGVDLGLNYYDPERTWSLSLVAKNLGGQLKAYDEQYERMPIDLQAGLSRQLGTTPLRASLTLVDLNHWGYRFISHAVIGLDARLGESIWVGAGYNFRRADEMKVSGTDITGDDSSSSHGAGLSLGAGLDLDRFAIRLSYGKYHVSSSSVMVNVGYSF